MRHAPADLHDGEYFTQQTSIGTYRLYFAPFGNAEYGSVMHCEFNTHSDAERFAVKNLDCITDEHGVTRSIDQT